MTGIYLSSKKGMKKSMKKIVLFVAGLLLSIGIVAQAAPISQDGPPPPPPPPPPVHHHHHHHHHHQPPPPPPPPPPPSQQ